RFLIAVSWGGHESLIIPIITFYDIPGAPDPDLPWNLVRFYIGLEELDVLYKDILLALELL
ncbi:MAG: cystathionine beta-lyase, partial [Saprospiraceae bacterium]